MRPLTDNMKGALFMMASMASFTLNDAFMKSASAELPFFQALFLRSIASMLAMILIARALGSSSFRIAPHDRFWVLLRSLSEIGAAYFFITALFNMPIANVTAIIQALPLTVSLAAAMFLGEPIGWRRLIAIAVGFAGVMLIVRPGAEEFSIHSIYALFAVLAVTVRDIAVRKISSDTSSSIVAVFAALAVLLFAGAGASAIEWVPMTTRSSLLLAGASVFIVGGYLFSVMTMRVGDIAFTAPFRYTSLLWALFLGALVFSEWPDGITLLGAALVVGTGLFTLYREQVIARRA